MFEPHVQTNGKASLFLFFFFREDIIAFVFVFGSLYLPYLEQGKKKKSQVGRLSSCWLVHDKHRVKNQVQIRYIERGMASLPRWQHLCWPSSYTRWVQLELGLRRS